MPEPGEDDHVPGTHASDDDVPEMTVTELSASLERGEAPVLVDVREPFERRIADLPDVGQIRIPMGELEARIHELDPDDRMILYCRTGARSGLATRFLRARGFGRAVNLKGGLMAWRQEVDPSLRAY